MSFPDGGLHARQSRSLDSYDPDAGVVFFQGTSETANQPTTSDRRHHCIQTRNLFEKFQTDCSLSGNYSIVVKRMNQCKSKCFSTTARFVAGLVIIGAVQN